MDRLTSPALKVEEWAIRESETILSIISWFRGGYNHESRVVGWMDRDQLGGSRASPPEVKVEVVEEERERRRRGRGRGKNEVQLKTLFWMQRL